MCIITEVCEKHTMCQESFDDRTTFDEMVHKLGRELAVEVEQENTENLLPTKKKVRQGRESVSKRAGSSRAPRRIAPFEYSGVPPACHHHWSTHIRW